MAKDVSPLRLGIQPVCGPQVPGDTAQVRDWETAKAAHCSHKVKAPAGPKGAADWAPLLHRHLHYYSQGSKPLRHLRTSWKMPPGTPRNREWGLWEGGAPCLGHCATTSRGTRSKTEPSLLMGSHLCLQAYETCSELGLWNKVIDIFNIHKEWKMDDLIWVTLGQKGSIFNLQEQMCFSVQMLKRHKTIRLTTM